MPNYNYSSTYPDVTLIKVCNLTIQKHIINELLTKYQPLINKCAGIKFICPQNLTISIVKPFAINDKILVLKVEDINTYINNKIDYLSTKIYNYNYVENQHKNQIINSLIMGSGLLLLGMLSSAYTLYNYPKRN